MLGILAVPVNMALFCCLFNFLVQNLSPIRVCLCQGVLYYIIAKLVLKKVSQGNVFRAFGRKNRHLNYSVNYIVFLRKRRTLDAVFDDVRAQLVE